MVGESTAGGGGGGGAGAGRRRTSYASRVFLGLSAVVGVQSTGNHRVGVGRRRVTLACVPGGRGRVRRLLAAATRAPAPSLYHHMGICFFSRPPTWAPAPSLYPHTGICFIKPLHGHLLFLCTPTKAPAASLYRYTGTCSSSTSAGSRTRAGTRNDSPEAAPHGRARWYAVFRVACHVLAYSNSCVNPFIYHYGAAARRVTLNLYRTGLTSGRTDRHRNDAVRFPVRTRRRAASTVATA